MRLPLTFLTFWLSAFGAHAQALSPIAGVPPALIEDLVLGSRILAEFGVVDASVMSARAARPIPSIS